MIFLERASILRYEDIKKYLVDAVTLYCGIESERRIRNFIRRQVNNQNNEYSNRFINVPEDVDIKRRIKQDYLGKCKIINGKEIYEPSYTGEIGSIEEMEAQMEAIRDSALLMLMSNRVSKQLNWLINNTDHGEFNADAYRRDAGVWLRNKDIAFQSLITCLNILNYDNTEDNPDYKINYGMGKDTSKSSEKQDIFIIDVPYVGQICIHMGDRTNYEINLKKINIATKNALKLRIRAKLLEEEKKLCGEKIAEGMSEDEAKLYARNMLKGRYEQEISRMEAKIDSVRNIHDYNGKLFEISSAIPIEMKFSEIKGMKEISEKFNDLEHPTGSEIFEFVNGINSVDNKGYNPREIHFLAIKLGWGAGKIQVADKLSDLAYNKSQNNLRDDFKRDRKRLSGNHVKIMGKSAVISTTPEERVAVKAHEKIKKREPKKRAQGIR